MVIGLGLGLGLGLEDNWPWLDLVHAVFEPIPETYSLSPHHFANRINPNYI